MFARKLLLFALFAASTLCFDNSSICKLLPDFGGVGNTTATPLPTDPKPKFCRNLNSTCCSNADFQKMSDVWEGGASSSLRSKRTNEMKDMVKLVGTLEKINTDLLWMSQEIKKAKIEADPACSTPAYIHRKMHELELVQTAITNFKQTGKRCWQYTKNLMNGLMCAACDHKAQDFIDSKKKELTISKNECTSFLTSCGDHLKAIQSVFFYFNTYHRLTYCDLKGRFTVQKVPDFMDFPKNVRLAIDSCFNNNNQDDCVVVCQSQIGFSAMVNYEYNNKHRLFSEKIDIDKFIKTLTNDTTAKAQSKRVLQNSVAKDVDETLSRINNYTIRVTSQGLDLVKYTVEDKDGYKDIDLNEVLSAKIFAISFFWTLLATYV
jgi:hypothetical protein